MTPLTMKTLHEDALHFMGENADVVKKQWAEDIPMMFYFKDLFEDEALPLRFKVLLDQGDVIASFTLSLCVPRYCLSQEDHVVIHMTMRALVEIFGDALVGILHFQNQTTECMTHKMLQGYKNDPVFKKNVNLLSVEAYLRAQGKYREFESLYALEFKDRDDANTLISCTEIYHNQRRTSIEGAAKEVFTVPIQQLFLMPTEPADKKLVIDVLNDFQSLISTQVQTALAGRINMVPPVHQATDIFEA